MFPFLFIFLYFHITACIKGAFRLTGVLLSRKIYFDCYEVACGLRGPFDEWTTEPAVRAKQSLLSQRWVHTLDSHLSQALVIACRPHSVSRGWWLRALVNLRQGKFAGMGITVLERPTSRMGKPNGADIAYLTLCCLSRTWSLLGSLNHTREVRFGFWIWWSFSKSRIFIWPWRTDVRNLFVRN